MFGAVPGTVKLLIYSLRNLWPLLLSRCVTFSPSDSMTAESQESQGLVENI